MAEGGAVVEVRVRCALSEAELDELIGAALERGLPLLHEKPVEIGEEVTIAAGGPSLALFQPRGTVVALNGAVKKVKADVAMCYDPTPDNAAFYDDPPDIPYLIGSRAHPGVFDALKDRDVRLWHVRDIPELKRGLRVMPGQGCAIGVRSLYILHALGARVFHIYGLDSCIMGGQHHAYSQPWQDGQQSMTLKILGRQYQCAAWHVIQAEEFFRALGQLPDAECHVYGEGLIAWALRKNRELCPTLGLRANHAEVERG